jgi:hypothetical protein
VTGLRPLRRAGINGLCLGLLRLSLIAAQQREQCARVDAKKEANNEDNDGA